MDYSAAAQAAADGQPVQFERDAPEADPFGLDQSLTDVRSICGGYPVLCTACMQPMWEIRLSRWLRWSCVKLVSDKTKELQRGLCIICEVGPRGLCCDSR